MNLDTNFGKEPRQRTSLHESRYKLWQRTSTKNLDKEPLSMNLDTNFDKEPWHRGLGKNLDKETWFVARQRVIVSGMNRRINIYK